MKILLVRHGEKEGHGFESPLTEKGREQVGTLSRNLPSYFKKIYSSSNPRSIESAKIIANEKNLDFKILDKIREFDKSLFFEDFDSLEEEKIKYNDLISFIKDISERGEDVCLVMNAGINRVIICHLLNYPLKNAITLTQDFASFTELEKKDIYGKKVWCINSINNTFNENEQ